MDTGDNVDALNNENFLNQFKFMRIQNHLEQLHRNRTLMSPDVQHELLESAACSLLIRIKAEFFEPGRYYVLMADGYEDELKRELVAVRYVHTGKIKEWTTRFRDTNISEKILQVIEPLQLDPSLCVGSSLD